MEVLGSKTVRDVAIWVVLRTSPNHSCHHLSTSVNDSMFIRDLEDKTSQIASGTDAHVAS
jgi:hypothetical protein